MNATAMPEVAALVPAKLEAKSAAVVDVAAGMEVVDSDSHGELVGYVRDYLLPLRDEIKATFDPLCSQANALHKSLTGTRGKFLAPVLEAIDTANGKVGRYLDRVERERLAAERRALEAVERAEARRLAAGAMPILWSAVAEGLEWSRAQEAAKSAGDAESVAELERIAETAIPTAAPCPVEPDYSFSPPTPTVAKPGGQAVGREIVVEVRDKRGALAIIAADPQLEGLAEILEPALRNLARSLGARAVTDMFRGAIVIEERAKSIIRR